MNFFGRSRKKHNATPQLQATASFNSTIYLPGQYAIASQTNLLDGNQTPHTSSSNAEPPVQLQGWPGSDPKQPISIIQINYIAAPAQQSQMQGGSRSTLDLSSMANLLPGNVPQCVLGARISNDGISTWQHQSTQYLNPSNALCDIIASKFDAVINLIDGERFGGDEGDLAILQLPQATLPELQYEAEDRSRGLAFGKAKAGVHNSNSPSPSRIDYFSKVHLYVNSRVIENLPPMRLYLPTFPLLCLAAQYSQRVYKSPVGKERDEHIEADWRHGTKAMVIKSMPMDHMNVIVFAVRGTQTFMDWTINLNTEPTSPDGFLDDPGNLCHSGFLSVAKKMIKPVAARLRHLLEEDPSRSSYSLLITGHSAGGAVAALLYSHMLSTSPEAKSELTILTRFFKRIHCIKFGAPPVSLLPLVTPTGSHLRHSLFLSFINEGDPVTRADKPYIQSLLKLYTTTAPNSLNSNLEHNSSANLLSPPISNSGGRSSSSLSLNKIKLYPKKSKPAPEPIPGYGVMWNVPEAQLSNAGRLVLLRGVERPGSRSDSKKKEKSIQERMDEGVVAQMITDDLLRGVVFGDPVCHMMGLYRRRLEVLATNAAIGRHD